jgi:SAM-dependent methyltransferase
MRKRAKHGEARGVPLPHDVRVLTHEQAQAFYNRMGTKQDWQAFYEAKATHELIAHASFETAQAVFEFGCGTGAFAERLLTVHVSPEAQYVAVDSSPTMIRLARARLARFGSRVEVQQTDGTLRFEATSGFYDRFVSTYVADLLSASDIAEMLETRRAAVSGESDARADVVQPTGDRAVDRHPSARAFLGRRVPASGTTGVASRL